MRNNEIIDVKEVDVSSRIITFFEKYRISDIKSIYNATRNKFVFIPIDTNYIATTDGYNFIWNAGLVTTGWADTDEFVVNVITKPKFENVFEVGESYQARLLKIGKPAFFHYLGYPINETAQSLIHRPNAQKIFIPLYIHLHCNKDFESYIRYSESSTNNVTDADAYVNTNNQFSNENLIDIIQRKAGMPYQLKLDGEIRVQGNDGVSVNQGFIKNQVKTLSGQGNGLLFGIVRGVEVTQELF